MTPFAGPGPRPLVAALWPWGSTAVRCLLALCLIGLAGEACAYYQEAFWAGDCLLTLYSLSQKHLRQGADTLGLRVQDRDYVILDRLQAPRLFLRMDGWEQRVNLLPGPGRDYRGQVVFPKTGRCLLEIQFTLPDGRQVVFKRPMKIAGPPRCIPQKKQEDGHARTD